MSDLHELTERHGGTAQAASDGPGRGSTFTISVPRFEPAAPEQDEAAAQQST